MNNPEMPPQDALALLDSVCAQVKATREEHVRIQDACKVLKPVANGCTLVDVQKYLDMRIDDLLHERSTKPSGSPHELNLRVDLLREVRAEFFGSNQSGSVDS